MPAILDYILLFIIAIAAPVLTLHGYGKFKRRIAAGDPNARSREYIYTMLWQWGMSAAVIVLWIITARSWSELGFVPEPGWNLLLGAIITAALAGFCVFQWYSVCSATGENRNRIMQQVKPHLDPVKDILPHNQREMRLFAGVSITAGVCEELLYRAYLIWVLAAFIGWIAAATVAVLIFAVAHLYQGVPAAIRVFLVGAVMAALYLWTKCLWLPIVLHAVIDLTNGAIAYHALRREPAGNGGKNNQLQTA